MKITDVRAVQPIAADSPPDWRTSLGQILVAVDTDAGLTGYGVGGGGGGVVLHGLPHQSFCMTDSGFSFAFQFGRFVGMRLHFVEKL